MRLTFTKSAYDLEDGKCLARFDGVTLKEATGAKNQRGELMPPGMTWDFTILDGPNAGKRTDRLTGRTPTPKSGCGKFLAGVADTLLKDGTEVDIAQFVGKVYRLTIEDGRVSDNPAPVRVYDPAPAAPPRSGPPPRNKPATPPEKKFWVPVGDETPLLTAAEIRERIEKAQLTLDAEICPEGGEEYKPVAELLPEMKDVVPF